MAMVTFMVDVDTATGEAKLKRFGQQAEQTVNKTSSAFSRLKEGAKGWGDTFAGEFASMTAGFVSGQIALDAFYKAVGLTTRLIFDSVNEYAQSDLVVRKLSAAFAGLRVSVPGATERAKEFADELSMLTAVDDEVILGAQQMLVSIGRLSGDGLERATKAALDMAAATGVDLKAAAEAVARGVQGTGRGLQQFGIIVEKDASETERLAQIVNQASEKFGGMAVAAGSTLQGEMDKLSIATGNLKASVGELLSRTFELPQAFDDWSWAIQRMSGVLGENADVGEKHRGLVERIVQQLGPLAVAAYVSTQELHEYRDANRDASAEAKKLADAIVACHGPQQTQTDDTKENAKAVYDLAAAYEAFFEKVRRGQVDQLLPFGQDVPYMNPQTGGFPGPTQPPFRDNTPAAPIWGGGMLPPDPSQPGEVSPWGQYIAEFTGFVDTFEYQTARLAGAGETFASGWAAVYGAIGASADVLAASLGKQDSFAKGMRKIQATMLMVTGVVAIYEGAVKFASGLPYDYPRMAAGLTEVAKGAAAVAQARALGASGGGGGAASATGGGGGGKNPRDQAVATSPTGQGAQKMPAPVVNVYVEGSVTAQTDLARTIAEEIRRQYGRAGIGG